MKGDDKMKKDHRQHLALSVHQEDREMIAKLANSLHLTMAELIIYSVRKMARDKVAQQIMLQELVESKGDKISKERLLRIMSVKKSLKKEPSTQRNGSSVAVSSNNLLNYTEEQLQEAIKIAHMPIKGLYKGNM